MCIPCRSNRAIGRRKLAQRNFKVLRTFLTRNTANWRQLAVSGRLFSMSTIPARFHEEGITPSILIDFSISCIRVRSSCCFPMTAQSPSNPGRWTIGKSKKYSLLERSVSWRNVKEIIARNISLRHINLWSQRMREETMKKSEKEKFPPNVERIILPSVFLCGFLSLWFCILKFLKQPVGLITCEMKRESKLPTISSIALIIEFDISPRGNERSLFFSVHIRGQKWRFDFRPRRQLDSYRAVHPTQSPPSQALTSLSHALWHRLPLSLFLSFSPSPSLHSLTYITTLRSSHRMPCNFAILFQLSPLSCQSLLHASIIFVLFQSFLSVAWYMCK